MGMVPMSECMRPPPRVDFESISDWDTLTLIPCAPPVPRHFADTVPPPGRKVAPKEYTPELL